MSNFPCGITRNITSHSMENLAFHSLLRWQIIILPILTMSPIHFPLGKLGECTFSDVFDSRTQTGSHYFVIIYCLKEQHERKTASPLVCDFLSNTLTHAHWLQCRNGDFRLTSVIQKRLRLSSPLWPYSVASRHVRHSYVVLCEFRVR